jgi:hypothetical protein
LGSIKHGALFKTSYELMPYRRFLELLEPGISLSDRALSSAAEEVRLFMKEERIFSAAVSIQILGPKRSSTNGCK